MIINSWETFVDAVDEFIKMNEDNSYLFEPKRQEKKKLQNEIKTAIKDHRKKVLALAEKKQLDLFTEN